MALGALALVALLAIGCACGLMGMFGWLMSEAPDIASSEEIGRREGVRDGASSTSDECLREGYRRTSACADFEIVCKAGAEDYTLACLNAVVAPDPSLCFGAPAAVGFLPDARFLSTTCTRLGWSTEDLACQDIVAYLEQHCVANRR